MHISTRVIIESRLEKVWDVFNNLEEYHEWNPYIRKIDGELYVGSKLKILLNSPDSQLKTIKPVVQKLLIYNELSWLYKSIIPGIIMRKHTFQFQKIDDETTMFVNEERLSGIIIPMTYTGINSKLRQRFESMNIAFKQRCESK